MKKLPTMKKTYPDINILLSLIMLCLCGNCTTFISPQSNPSAPTIQSAPFRPISYEEQMKLWALEKYRKLRAEAKAEKFYKKNIPSNKTKVNLRTFPKKVQLIEQHFNEEALRMETIQNMEYFCIKRPVSKIYDESNCLQVLQNIHALCLEDLGLVAQGFHPQALECLKKKLTSITY